jgi:hypothetical protein
MSLQSHKSPNFGNFRTPTSESQEKMTFGCWPCRQAQIILLGEGGGFPQVRAMMSFVSLCKRPWLVRAPKVLQLGINQLFVWFVQVCVSN